MKEIAGTQYSPGFDFSREPRFSFFITAGKNKSLIESTLQNIALLPYLRNYVNGSVHYCPTPHSPSPQGF